MSKTDHLCSSEIMVSFGDCDPASIAYFPNFFRWSDALFHRFLHNNVNGHSAICAKLGAKGLGVMSVQMTFRLPATAGDLLVLSLKGINWSDHSFSLEYEGHINGKLTISAHETRGIFVVETGGRIKAGDTQDLRSTLG